MVAKLFWFLLIVGILAAAYRILRKRKVRKDEFVVHSEYLPLADQVDLSNPDYEVVPGLWEIPEEARCPYGDGNIRETFYDDAIVKCSSCGAFHHKSCFDYYGGCGSIRCRAKSS